MQILTQIIMGITTGGNILMSQYYGSRDPVNREKTNRTLFFFSVTAGAVMTVAVLVLSRPILIGLRAPALEEATAYLTVCALGLIPIFGYNALSAMLRSVGNSRQPFYCVAVTAGVNIVLDCLFMGAFHWGVRGGGPGHGDGPDGQLCGLPVVRPAAPGSLRPDPAPGRDRTGQAHPDAEAGYPQRGADDGGGPELAGHAVLINATG